MRDFPLSRPAQRTGMLLGGITAWVSMLVLTGLGIGALLYTSRFDPTTYAEAVTICRRSLPAALAFSFLLALPCAAAVRLPDAVHRFAPVWAGVLTTLCGCLWTVTLRAQPRNDQAYVWEMAVALVEHNPEPFAADYAVAYPHQFGAALLASFLVRLFGTNAVPAFGIFNSLCAGACAAVLCLLARELCGEVHAGTVCGALCLLFCPLALYAAFVYGTVFSAAASFWAMYGALRLCRGGSIQWWIPVLVLLPLACVSYGNSLIFAVAVFLLLFFTGLLHGRHGIFRLCFPALMLIALCAFFPGACREFVCRQMQVASPSGMPKTAWIAMGIHSSNGVCGPGSWDGSNWDLFFSNGADSRATHIAAVQNIRQYLKGYRDDPHRLLFFAEKTACQWLDPWFGALTQNYAPDSATALAPAQWLCVGAGLHPVQGILTALLSIFYLGAAAGIFLLWRRLPDRLWPQLLPLLFLGGFAFQLIWESKSRYCLPFVLALLPLAAVAVTRLGLWLPGVLRRAMRR